MKKVPLFIPLLLLFHSPAYGEWKQSGSFGAYINALGIESTPSVPKDKSGLVLDFQLENKINSKWRFKSDLFVRTDFLAKDASEQFQFIPKNFYLQHRRGSLEFKFGFQTLALDGPDIINPADIVQAKNWVDPTAPLPMSSAGISLSQELDEWSWELLYIPRQTAAQLPGEHSPWLPRENRLPIESEDTEFKIPNNVSYQYLDPVELNNARDHNVALKLQKKADNFEGQFLYYNGLSQTPFLLTKVSGTLISVNPEVILVDSPVKLQPLYYRQQAVAGTFMIPFESWAIRGGFNWLSPQGNDPRIPKETYLAVLGFEKSFETSYGLVTGVLDFVKQELQDANQISFLRSVFEEAVVFGARIPYGEETQFYTGGVYDLVGKSSLYKFAATHRVSSNFSLEAQAQFLQGPSDTMIGLYQKYDSYQAKLIFHW